MKKPIGMIITLMLVLTMGLFLTACGDSKGQDQKASETESSGQENDADVDGNLDPDTVTDSEQETIDLLAEDTTVVTDETYGEIISEAANHPDVFGGQVIQVEGLFTVTHDGDTPYICRTMVNGEEETFCGLPLVYLNKQFQEGDWIKVTGVINAHEINGVSVSALEIVAVQRLEKAGQAVLPWSGPSHEH